MHLLKTGVERQEARAGEGEKKIEEEEEEEDGEQEEEEEEKTMILFGSMQFVGRGSGEEGQQGRRRIKGEVTGALLFQLGFELLVPPLERVADLRNLSARRCVYVCSRALASDRE